MLFSTVILFSISILVGVPVVRGNTEAKNVADLRINRQGFDACRSGDGLNAATNNADDLRRRTNRLRHLFTRNNRVSQKKKLFMK